MNRNPKAGDIIQIGTKRVEHLVIDGGGRVEGDTRAGCTYEWFAAVPANQIDPITGAVDGNKEKTYYTQCVGADYPITPLESIRLLATAKFKKVVTVQYLIGKVKDV
jgi:hypothetical protein